MPTLVFVQPAYRRYALSDICLRQRRWLCDELREHGIEATCLVVSDDDNLDLAQAQGFATVERDNRWLGRRFNDGYEWAANEGADYVFAIGSDMWALPDMWADLPAEPPADVWYMHRALSVIPVPGDRRYDMTITGRQGCLRTMPTQTLKRVRYRPCKDNIARGCDSSTWQRAKRKHFALTECFAHSLELVGFQSRDVQITDYTKLRARWPGSEVRGPEVFSDLAAVYPEALVTDVTRYYEDGARGLAGGTRLAL